MESFGYTIRQFEGYTGFTAELTVNPAYRLIAYRTDIDGLEMPDMTCNEHSSRTRRLRPQPWSRHPYDHRADCGKIPQRTPR